MKAAPYELDDIAELLTPSVVVFDELLQGNLRKMLEIAGGPQRLRPHCKTHKTRQLVERWVQLGVLRHKCATFAEAEMAALAGASDVLLAYNLVGPNLRRAVEYRRRFPSVRFAVTADHSQPLRELSDIMASAGLTINVLLDVDSGQHRTGIADRADALRLYREMATLPGVAPAGLHLYDGQNHQSDPIERGKAVEQVWNIGRNLADAIEAQGMPVEAIVAGGTGSFPVFARQSDPRLQLSPGTCVFHDQGYRECFPDLPFVPAALLATRVISRPTADRLTLDLGYKAVASDPPAGKRLHFPDLPNAVEILQNEEHLVLQTDQANRYQPGDLLLAIPRHICPTCALHSFLYVVRDGKVVEQWDVVARDRSLTI